MRANTRTVLMRDAAMDCKVEHVAQALHQAEQQGRLWANQPAPVQERFREYSRNAIRLLDEDIGVLLVALEACSSGG